MTSINPTKFQLDQIARRVTLALAAVLESDEDMGSHEGTMDEAEAALNEAARLLHMPHLLEEA